MEGKFVIESITVNDQECKIVKAKAGGLVVEGDVLDFGAFAVKLQQALFNEGNQIIFVVRKLQ